MLIPTKSTSPRSAPKIPAAANGSGCRRYHSVGCGQTQGEGSHCSGQRKFRFFTHGFIQGRQDQEAAVSKNGDGHNIPDDGIAGVNAFLANEIQHMFSQFQRSARFLQKNADDNPQNDINPTLPIVPPNPSVMDSST